MVTSAAYDVIAWNPLAEALLGNLGDEPNLARRRFLHPSRGQSSGAEEFSCIAVARLRGAAARYPRDERLARLLAELRAGSEEFVQVWDTNPVRAPGHRSKTFAHPEIGPVRIDCDVLAVPDDDQRVVFMTADPGSPSARALRHLLRQARPPGQQITKPGRLPVQVSVGHGSGAPRGYGADQTTVSAGGVVRGRSGRPWRA